MCVACVMMCFAIVTDTLNPCLPQTWTRCSSEACVLETLANGGTGIWCGVCREGAMVGHASSAVTLLNLHRLGNKYVSQRYDLAALRQAAIAVTRITTGHDPVDNEEVYGPRSAEVVFGGPADPDAFHVTQAFGIKAAARITTFTTPEMFVDRLTDSFPGMIVPDNFDSARGGFQLGGTSTADRQHAQLDTVAASTAGAADSDAADSELRMPVADLEVPAPRSSTSSQQSRTRSVENEHGDDEPGGDSDGSSTSSTRTAVGRFVRTGDSDASVCSLKIARKMQALVTHDLVRGAKLHYNSYVGLLRLYQRAGGAVNDAMRVYAIDQEERLSGNPLLALLKRVSVTTT